MRLILLCLMILLAGCSTLTTTNNGPDGAPLVNVNQTQQTTHPAQSITIAKQAFYDIHINDVDTKQVVLVKTTKAGNYLISCKILKNFNIQNIEQMKVSLVKDTYCSPQKIEKASVSVNREDQILNIQVPVGSLGHKTLNPADITDRASLNRHSKTTTNSNIGGYMNYHLYGYNEGSDSGLSGLFDFHLFTSLGNFKSSFSARTDSPVGLTRLDTFYELNDYDNLRHLRIGDSTAYTGLGSGAMLFGGIQWGTDFSLDPYYNTYPIIPIRGQSTVPTQADLYINNRLVSSKNIPPGSYLYNVPQLQSGANDARLVMTNVLGEKQVFTGSLFANTRLLRTGLSEYQINLGLQRYNYGYQSNDYSNPFVSGYSKYGLTDTITGELFAGWSWSADVKNIGIGASFGLNASNTIHTGITTSESGSGFGKAINLGYYYRPHSALFDFAVSARKGSENFKRLGYSSNIANYTNNSLTTNAGLSLPNGYGRFSLSYVNQFGRSNVWGFSYNTNIAGLGGIRFNLYGGSGTSPSIGISLDLSDLIDTPSISLGGQFSDSMRTGYVAINQSTPQDGGFGYSANVGVGDEQSIDLVGNYQNQTLSTTAQIYHRAGQTIASANLSGSISYMDGYIHTQRRISSSFAEVKIPGFSNIPVYLNNTKIANTNAQGVAYIPRLLANVKNVISVKASDFDFNVDIPVLKKSIYPQKDTGTIVVFKATKQYSIQFRVKLPDGKYPVAGLRATTGKNNVMFGGNGLVYIANGKQQGDLIVPYKDGSCVVHYSVPKSDKAQIHKLGILQCKADK